MHPRRNLRVFCLLSLFTCLLLSSCSSSDESSATRDDSKIRDFLDLMGPNGRVATRALERIEQKWHPGNRVMLVEAFLLTRRRPISDRIIEVLERKTGKQLGTDAQKWFREIWNTPYEPHPYYASFKASCYEGIDASFREYFSRAADAKIRLDEIRWGGVARDGIPPLKNPLTITAGEATYLADTDVVFGVVVNGRARAYPKRILAWHEMVKDVVGGTKINGVYCTLCGSMIVYLPEHNGVHYELGTSGFLYRSNKLMYDHGTKSLWSTLKGEPVVGPLVGKGIKLKPHHVVTTTWGEWQTQHPTTRVLSLRTGHHRDYEEGAAYRSYFFTDDLMFTVPKTDDRLLNKDEVFVVRGVGGDSTPLAIAAKYLSQNTVYHDRIGDQKFVVVTDESGANRAYGTEGAFARLDDSGNLIDQDGTAWEVGEGAITSESGQRAARLPAHRAFWFGWQAAFPNTRLVK